MSLVNALTPPVLILMAGMPGAGKSTVALAMGSAFGMPVVDKDVIVSAVLDRGIPEDAAHPVAYQATFDLADHLVRIQGMSVIVDTPAVYPSTLDWAARLCAETGAHLIPVLCSADGEARSDRMATRQGLRSHSKGTTRRPGTARERFAHFPDDTIELDTMRPADDVVREAIAAIRLRIGKPNTSLRDG
jgi:predicted kinase